MKTLPLVLFSIYLCFTSCYSFRGISIPPEVNTFYVETFDNQTNLAPPTLPQDFTEQMKDKVRNESRLILTDTDPDIEFSGAITEYRVSYEAPQQDQTAAFNRLTISVQVEYTSNLDEKDNWKQRFSFFNDFESNVNLIDVESTLIETINKELVERIFNKAFTNW